MRGNGAAYMIAAIGLGVSAHRAAANVTVRDPGTYVVDRAGIIDDPVERQLEGWLRELEQKTTAQVKVLTVPSTDGEDFFSFVQRHAELWKLGHAGRDNGALIAVAVKEHQVRIQTGYGIEPILPDSWCGTVSRKVFAAHFKRGAYSEGIYQGTIAVANKVADAANVTLTGIPDFRYAASRGAPVAAVCGVGLVPFIVLIIVISSISRRRRHYGRWGGGRLMEGLFWGAMINNMMGGRRSSWGRGGFGGGSGSGFGGSFGGGGRFGGGGGGASW